MEEMKREIEMEETERDGGHFKSTENSDRKS